MSGLIHVLGYSELRVLHTTGWCNCVTYPDLSFDCWKYFSRNKRGVSTDGTDDRGPRLPRQTLSMTWVENSRFAFTHFVLPVVFHEILTSPLPLSVTFFPISHSTCDRTTPRFFIEPRRHKGVVHIFGHSKKKVVVVLDEPQIIAWKEKWNNSKVPRVTPRDVWKFGVVAVILSRWLLVSRYCMCCGLLFLPTQRR